MKQTIKQLCGMLLFTMLSLSGFAQKTDGLKVVTGNVIDNTGARMPGVNVIEKGTKNTVSTDFDGHYVITVKKGAVLTFAYVGMGKVDKAVGNETIINVTLKDDTTELRQVVVVGYGTQKKGNLTGSIETISPDKIKDLPVSNLAESLRGQIAGLNIDTQGSRPGDTSKLTIRQTFGFTSGTNSTPLIVIDDQIQVDPQTGLSTLDAFNRLDPSEIESITVLKDGSAAIYGSRASQGAIVVKTKRGKAGKMKFTYTNQFGINDAVSHVKTMSAYESGIYSNRLMQANGNDPLTSSKFYSPAELEEMKSLNYNWLEKAWKPAEQQKHSITVSGGDEKATYFAGLSYFTQGANLGEQDFQKWNFRTGMTAKLSKDLDFTASVSGNSGDVEKSFTKSSSSVANPYGGTSSAEQADYSLLLHMPKFVPITTMVNGKEYYMSPFNRADGNLGGTQNSNSSIAGWNYFALLDSGSKSVKSDFSYNVNAALNYNVPFVKGLALKGSFARTQTSSSTTQVALAFPLARITNFTTAGHHLASEATDADYNIADNVKQSRVTYENTNSKSTQANFFATYARTFGNHDFDAMFSIERSETNYDSTILYYDRGTKTTKDLYLGTSLTAGDLVQGFSNNFLSEAGTMSYLGRVNYSYKSKYLFQFVVRRDASTKFAPENYWGTFPGGQVGWVASKEDWFAKVLPAINYLKLRYSLGKTGNDNIQAWRWATYYDIVSDKGLQFGNSGGTLANAIAPRATANRDAGWDTHIKHDLGIDFNVFNNRLQVSADYYYDKGTEMLVSSAGIVDVPISVGGAFAEENIAGVNSWGSEFSLKWSDHIKDNFSYNIGVNFGLFAGNETTAYPDGALTDPSTNQQRTGSSSINPVWGFKVWKGTSTGDGILRTDADVTNYWNYLTANATAAGTTPNFLSITDISGVKKGMLAYQDLGGTFVSTTGLKPGPDGKIARNDDYGKLVNSNRTYGFTTNLGFKYSSVYLNTQIGTTWGGGVRYIDNVPQRTSTNDAYWARETFWNDMYGYDNLNGKYPNLAWRDNVSNDSDFWQVSTFSCYVRSLTLGYEFPELFTSQLGLSKATFGVTGYNLWYFNNPFPDHYRNMYDSSTNGYPTLRTWSLNLNVTF